MKWKIRYHFFATGDKQTLEEGQEITTINNQETVLHFDKSKELWHFEINVDSGSNPIDAMWDGLNEAGGTAREICNGPHGIRSILSYNMSQIFLDNQGDEEMSPEDILKINKETMNGCFQKWVDFSIGTHAIPKTKNEMNSPGDVWWTQVDYETLLEIQENVRKLT